MPLSPLARSYDQFIVDLDGTVYVGDELTPGAVGALEELRGAGKGVAFVTNNPRLSGEDYVRKLWKLGLRASLGDVVTVGGATQHLLAETRTGRTAFVIGSPAIVQHVADAGLRVMNGTDLASRAEVVLVAGTDRISYDDLRVATLAVRRGADFLATSRDPTYPMPDGMWPGTGALLAAVETASEREATLVGKPEPQLMITAVERMGEGPKPAPLTVPVPGGGRAPATGVAAPTRRTLVIGDRIDADGAAAAAAHLEFAIVLTGGADRAELEAAKDPVRPVAVADTLADLVTGGAP